MTIVAQVVEHRWRTVPARLAGAPATPARTSPGFTRDDDRSLLDALEVLGDEVDQRVAVRAELLGRHGRRR